MDVTEKVAADLKTKLRDYLRRGEVQAFWRLLTCDIESGGGYQEDEYSDEFKLWDKILDERFDFSDDGWSSLPLPSLNYNYNDFEIGKRDIDDD